MVLSDWKLAPSSFVVPISHLIWSENLRFCRLLGHAFCGSINLTQCLTNISYHPWVKSVGLRVQGLPIGNSAKISVVGSFPGTKQEVLSDTKFDLIRILSLMYEFSAIFRHFGSRHLNGDNVF